MGPIRTDQALLTGIMMMLIIMVFSMAGWTQDNEDEYMENYTGADADLVGSAVCMACHQDVGSGEGEETHISIFEADEENEHYGYGCEACHGPGGNHNGDPAGILDFTKMPIADVTDRCTMCHNEMGNFSLEDWQGGRHLAAGISCIACHSGHSANEYFLVEEDDVTLCSSCHVEVGEAFANGEHGAPGTDLTCSDCHNPHD
jgi:predicted CXXCH cytochrome family protein